LNQIPTEKTALLPCALDPFWEREFEPPTIVPSSKMVLLTVARLAASERYKGIEQVISAVAALRDRFPELEYRIVGDGDYRPHLEDCARQQGVADLVRFLGRVPPDALAQAYRDAALFVMPSQKEGFGIVFLEAALFGVPSVGGNHGGTPEVIASGETGFVVKYGDIAELIARVESLLTDAGRTRAMGQAARARVKHEFTYTSFRASLEGLVRPPFGS
jgi:glycosyltransferase involved in cell wall biosynthesis